MARTSRPTAQDPRRGTDAVQAVERALESLRACPDLGATSEEPVEDRVPVEPGARSR